MKKKVGIYGGSFDPIHLGHLITAQSVKEIRNFSEIIFVPTNKSPLKLNITASSTKDRLQMTKLAVEKYNGFSVSDYEINNSDISYSINTIKYFKEKYENVELIIGYDNFLIFDKWFKSEEILDLVDIVVLRRFFEKAIAPTINANKFVFVDTLTIEISSTMIRERILQDLPIDSLVSPDVLKFISKNKLYKK